MRLYYYVHVWLHDYIPVGEFQPTVVFYIHDAVTEWGLVWEKPEKKPPVVVPQFFIAERQNALSGLTLMHLKIFDEENVLLIIEEVPLGSRAGRTVSDFTVISNRPFNSTILFTC
jgi:hypothetical protein